ncbi:MAG: hypothetical protein ACXVB4_16430 [Pseudobdellovibrionaceae bacterium]
MILFMMDNKETSDFHISKSLEKGILPVEGSTLKLPLLLMHPASGDQGKNNHKQA